MYILKKKIACDTWKQGISIFSAKTTFVESASQQSENCIIKSDA
jgi:hypothetical protein